MSEKNYISEESKMEMEGINSDNEFNEVKPMQVDIIEELNES